MTAHDTMHPERRRRSSAWLFIISAIVLCALIAMFIFWWIPRDLARASAQSPADASYTLRGIIDTLPQSSGPDKYIKIHHEALPDFKNKEGKVVGMPEMIMDFEQLAPDVKLTDFKVGDVVDFTFEVRWSPRVVTRVSNMRKLDAGTVLPLKPVTESK